MIVVVCGNHDEGFEFVCYDGSEGTNPPFEIDVGLAQRASIKTWVSYNKLRKKKRAKKQTRLACLRKNEVITQTFERRRQTVSGSIIHFNEEMIKGQIKELVRGSVEENLNELLEAEAVRKCGENAQGDPRSGEQESIPGEGCRSGCRVESHETAGGRKESRNRH